jgi:ribulose-5-phosphate 4-epimerase/fuculose-1-phosphate aldolase
MNDPEGVIQYRLASTPGLPERLDGLDQLIAWRRMLRLLGLLGRDPERYGGFGFGNISLRLGKIGQEGARPPFVITGSQTGHLTDFTPEHFAVVTGWDIDQNRLAARGPIRPSSEALTHAAIYEVGQATQCVMHVHSPEIWRNASALALATTAPMATHGTPRMAEEVRRVVLSEPLRGILVMLGHEDGVVAWGDSPEAAGLGLLATLAQAFRLEA